MTCLERIKPLRALNKGAVGTAEGTWLTHSDFSDWESESEDDEEEVLLPWDT